MKMNGSAKAQVTNRRTLGLSILLVLLLGACTSQTATPTHPHPTATAVPPTVAPSSLPPTATQVPPATASPIPLTLQPIERDYWPTAGWRTSTPEEQGMDSEKLADLMDYLQIQKSFTIHSLLIIRNGYIVTDAYFYPYGPYMLHDLASATKSFMSTLVGIAINQGIIESVEQPVLDFFPDRTVANLDTNKKSMTLEDLLTMRSGLECHGESTTQEMMASPDWTQFALDQPMAADPGIRYNYCGLNPHLLSAIIQETTGMSALAFGAENLFRPLGVPDVYWPSDPQGNSWGWGDMKMTPHDMAKLGYLFLNEGQWDGQHVVSAAWVKAATSSQQSRGYGYQWWLKPSGSYFATGVGGQEIWVLPDRDTLVVMTGASGGGGSGAWGDQLMRSHIIPLTESAAPLPPNPDGVNLLESRVQQVATSPQPEPVPPMPEIAQRVNEQTYVFDSNPVGLQSFSVAFPEEAEAVLSLRFIDGNQIEWLIGLDNVLRFSPGLHGLRSGAKGRWESDNVFVVHRAEIGDSRPREEQYSATFDADQVTLRIDGVTLVGRLEE